mmetsp:Transcript_99658/g.321311  ORF Transcript_99658/g.321311 Transcript_99658/m.321311 type:complete len:305 (+) Transcript_99658:149-1063(+)
MNLPSTESLRMSPTLCPLTLFSHLSASSKRFRDCRTTSLSTGETRSNSRRSSEFVISRMWPAPFSVRCCTLAQISSRMPRQAMKAASSSSLQSSGVRTGCPCRESFFEGRRRPQSGCSAAAGPQWLLPALAPAAAAVPTSPVLFPLACCTGAEAEAVPDVGAGSQGSETDCLGRRGTFFVCAGNCFSSSSALVERLQASTPGQAGPSSGGASPDCDRDAGLSSSPSLLRGASSGMGWPSVVSGDARRLFSSHKENTMLPPTPPPFQPSLGEAIRSAEADLLRGDAERDLLGLEHLSRPWPRVEP